MSKGNCNIIREGHLSIGCRDVTSAPLKCQSANVPTDSVIWSVKHENTCVQQRRARTHTPTDTVCTHNTHTVWDTCTEHLKGGNFIFQAQEAHICHRVSHHVFPLVKDKGTGSNSPRDYSIMCSYSPQSLFSSLPAKQPEIPHNLHFHSSNMGETTLPNISGC